MTQVQSSSGINIVLSHSFLSPTLNSIVGERKQWSKATKYIYLMGTNAFSLSICGRETNG